MRTSRSQVRVHLVSSLIFTLVFSNLIHFTSVPAHAQQRKPIIITADQPNVWTLEQAHYLLAQMHRRNLDLRAKRLEDLDANEINGLNFDVLKTLIEVGGTFNGADRLNNQLVSRDKRLNAERRPLLLARHDNLRIESLTLTP